MEIIERHFNDIKNEDYDETNQVHLDNVDKIKKCINLITDLNEFYVGDSLPLKHTFTDGIYVREIFIPKGHFLVGKVHRHEHPNFLVSGSVKVLTFNGFEILHAPKFMISKAKTQRVVLALEDTVWITVHATEETDLEKIEEYVIDKEATIEMLKNGINLPKDINLTMLMEV